MVEHRAYRYALCHALRALRQAAARSACTRTLLMACVAWSLFLWSGRKILSSSAPSVVIRVRSACILLFSRPDRVQVVGLLCRPGRAGRRGVVLWSAAGMRRVRVDLGAKCGE